VLFPASTREYFTEPAPPSLISGDFDYNPNDLDLSRLGKADRIPLSSASLRNPIMTDQLTPVNIRERLRVFLENLPIAM